MNHICVACLSKEDAVNRLKLLLGQIKQLTGRGFIRQIVQADDNATTCSGQTLQRRVSRQGTGKRSKHDG